VAAGSIVIDLLMKTGAFETDTKRAEAALARFKKQSMDTAKQLAGVFTAAGAAISAFALQSVAAADKVGEAAERFNVSAEALSSLQFAAQLTGVESEQLGRALVRLAGDAGSGGVKLSALGVALTDAAGKAKTADQLFADVADVFANLPDGVSKTALAIDIFGEKIGPTLVPLLNQGRAGLADFRAEAQRLGVVLDDDFAKAAGLFNDNLDRLKLLAQGVGFSIAQTILPAVNSLVTAFLEAVKSSDRLFTALTALAGLNPFGTTASNLAAARRELEKLLKQEADGNEARRRFTGGPGAAILNRLNIGAPQDLTPRIQQLQAQIAALESLQAGPTPAAPGTGTFPVLGAGAGAGGVPKKARDEIDFAELLRRNAELREKIGQKEEEDATRLYEAQKQFELDLQATRSLAAQARIDAAEQTAEAFIRQQQAEADAIRDKIDPLREYERTLERIAELERGGFLTESESVAAVSQASDAFRKLGTEAQKTDDITKSLGLTFSSAFESAIAGGQGLKGALKGLEQDLLRLGTRKLLTEPFLKLFEGGANGSASPASGFLSGLAGSAGSFLSGLIPGFATGTDFVPRTGLALVHQGEKITPAAENRAGMGGRNIVFNISTPDANSFRSSSGQIAAKMALAIAAGQRNI
jgi:hypothetical protein